MPFEQAYFALCPLVYRNASNLQAPGDSNRQKQPAILAHFESVSDTVVRFC